MLFLRKITNSQRKKKAVAFINLLQGLSKSFSETGVLLYTWDKSPVLLFVKPNQYEGPLRRMGTSWARRSIWCLRSPALQKVRTTDSSQPLSLLTITLLSCLDCWWLHDCHRIGWVAGNCCSQNTHTHTGHIIRSLGNTKAIRAQRSEANVWAARWQHFAKTRAHVWDKQDDSSLETVWKV